MKKPVDYEKVKEIIQDKDEISTLCQVKAVRKYPNTDSASREEQILLGVLFFSLKRSFTLVTQAHRNLRLLGSDNSPASYS